MDFNYAGHRKLWLLLSENIQAAARNNHSGSGYYDAYSALEKLKKELLLQFFSAEERNPRNYCFACQSALLNQEAHWIDVDEIHCEFCPLQWPEGLHCDDGGSLYCKLIDCLQNSDIIGAGAICIEIAAVKSYAEEEYERHISQEVKN